jgi:hypothetical protein
MWSGQSPRRGDANDETAMTNRDESIEAVYDFLPAPRHFAGFQA